MVYNVDGLHHDANARFAAGTLDLPIGRVMKLA